MRRVVAFFEWQRSWWLQHARDGVWTSQADSLTFAHTSDYVEGHIAYAKRQAGIRAALSERCREAWKGTELYLTLGETL